MKSLKPIFFTSDWHVGHKNIIQYSNRPFKDLEHMHESLIKRFNSTVPEDGVTYFLGDMGLGKVEVLKSVVDQLNGIKLIILGNHDKGMNSMYNLGFDAVLYGATLYLNETQITLTHCPLRGTKRENTEGMNNCDGTENWHGEYKNIKFSTFDIGQFHLHGHIHSPNGGRAEKILGKQFDVGVDANNYTPVSWSTIESWIAKCRK